DLRGARARRRLRVEPARQDVEQRLAQVLRVEQVGAHAEIAVADLEELARDGADLVARGWSQSCGAARREEVGELRAHAGVVARRGGAHGFEPRAVMER